MNDDLHGSSQTHPSLEDAARGHPHGERPTPMPSGGDDRFRALVESVQDYAIFMLDRDGCIVSWNRGAERLKGYRAEEIVGQSFTRFYTPEDLARGLPASLLRRATVEGRVECEGWRVRKDGTRFWADVVITALRDAAGNLTGYGKVTRDLTERREVAERLRASEERLRLLVDSVQDYAIFMLDPEGRVESWNTGAERIKGYRSEEILGKPFTRFYTAEDRERGLPEALLRQAREEGHAEDEGWRVRKDGSRFWAEVVLAALRGEGGRLVGFSKVTRDLSDRMRLEEERLRAARAQEAVRLRDEFLSIASHELRTPLTALQLDMDILARLVEGGAPKTLRQMDRAMRSVRRLGDLVGTLLDVSRLAAGQFELRRERFELGVAVQEVIGRLSAQASSVGSTLSFRSEAPVAGWWDRLRVEQVVTNLLANALRYAPGTPVEIAVRREDAAAVLAVRDHGPGLRDDLLPILFQRFAQDASARQLGGLGLGLYITRHIVEAHGGTVAAENAPGGGALFLVRFPLGEAVPSGPASGTPVP